MINLVKTGQNIKSMREFEEVQTVYNWQSGKPLPSIENLKILSELFNKPMDEILIFE